RGMRARRRIRATHRDDPPVPEVTPLVSDSPHGARRGGRVGTNSGTGPIDAEARVPASPARDPDPPLAEPETVQGPGNGAGRAVIVEPMGAPAGRPHRSPRKGSVRRLIDKRNGHVFFQGRVMVRRRVY